MRLRREPRTNTRPPLLPERITLHPIVLRPFTSADAPRVKILAGDAELAASTSHIPHPYGEGVADQWIATHAALRNRGTAFVYAVARADEKVLVGAVEVRLAPEATDSLGYWIGRPYWGRGYATAAVRAVIAMSFGYLDCNRLTASHLARNTASRRVLEKCGLAFVREMEREHRGKVEIFCGRQISRDAWEQRLERL